MGKKKSSALARQSTTVHSLCKRLYPVSTEFKGLQENSSDYIKQLQKAENSSRQTSQGSAITAHEGLSSNLNYAFAFPVFCPAFTLNAYLMPRLLPRINSEE